MGRKPKNSVVSEVTPKSEPSTSAAAETPTRSAAAFVDRNASEDGERPRRKRLSFNVTEDGKLDWDSLKGKNKSEVTDLIRNDPEIARLAGKDLTGEEAPFQFTTEDARLALTMLNQANAFTSRFFFGRFKNFPLDADICDSSFRFDPEDEKILSERGARLANRYSGEWLRKNAELVMFVGLYFKGVTKMTMTAVMAQVERNEAKAQQVKPNGHGVAPGPARA